MLFGIFLFIFVIVCIFLCLLILIQSDKGGGISGAIGGGFASGASNLLGSQDTANILTRATTIFASVFLGLCLVLSVFLSHPTGSQVKSALKERAEKQGGGFNPSSVLQGGGLPMGNQAAPQGIPGAAPQGIPGAGAAQQNQAPVVPQSVPSPAGKK
jgi:preprotein translocase subunit SecG